MNRVLTKVARSTVARAAAIALAACAVAQGCGPGHGRYTTEHKVQARERLDGVKAGSEFQMAEQQFLAGDLEKAIRSIERSIALNDFVPRSHTLRARILIEQGRFEDAAASLARALAINPDHHEALYYDGILLERVSAYARAHERYLRAWELNPSSAQYALATSEMLVEIGRVADAERFLIDLRSRFEHNAGVRQALGHIAMLRNDPERALALYNEARLLATDDQGVLEDLARAQFATSRFVEAEYTLSRLLEADANRPRRDLQRLRARCLMRIDRPVEAREILLGLTTDAQGASDVESWIDLGGVALTLGDAARVRIAANRAVALAPERPEGHMLLAAHRRASGDLAGALQLADRAAGVAPDDPSPLMLRGMLLRELGRHDDAAQSFARALAMKPTDDRASAMLAGVETPE